MQENVFTVVIPIKNDRQNHLYQILEELGLFTRTRREMKK